MMRRFKYSAGAVLVLSLIALLVFACSKEKNPVSAFQPEIANNQNDFQFQATGLTNVTTTVTYPWDNTGTSANINQSCAITGGTAALSIMDASGREVYTGNLSDNGTFASIAGTSGAWTIRVDLYSVDGTLNFRVQAP